MPDPFHPDQIDSTSRALRGLAWTLLRDHHLAEDAVQDTWLASIEHPPCEQGRRAGFLRRIARNISLAAIAKSHHRQRWEHAASRPEALAAPAELAERVERRREVLDAVLALDEPYRSTIILRFFENLSPNDIAEREGTPASTVRVRLLRGLQKLRSRLEASHGPKGLHGMLLMVAGLPPAAVVATTAAASGSVFALMTSGVVLMKSKIGVLTALVVLVVTGFTFFEFSEERKRMPATDASALEVAIPPTDRSTGATAALVATVPFRSADDMTSMSVLGANATLQVKGGVIDDRRVPVPGATVRLLVDGNEVQTTRSGPDGAFIIPLPGEDRSRLTAATAHASMGPDRAVFGVPENFGIENTSVIDFGLLRLVPAQDLEVMVRDGGAGVPGAEIEMSPPGYGRLRARAGPDGMIRWSSMPDGTYRLRARSETSGSDEIVIELPRPSSAPVIIDLEPTWTTTLTFRSAESGQPVSGLVAGVRPILAGGYGFLQTAPPTDDSGSTTITGLQKGKDFAIEVVSAGWHLPWIEDALVRGPNVGLLCATREARIEVQPNPTLRFHLVDGEVPPPPDGTLLRLVDLNRPASDTYNQPARIEGSDLVVTGLNPGRGRPYAVGLDGSFAELMTSVGQKEFKTCFRRPRTLEVRVVDDVGVPIRDFPLTLRPTGFSWREWARPTDAEGVVRWTGLYGYLGKVFFGGRSEQLNREPLGLVDLEPGDQRLEIRVLPEQEAVLRVSVGGERRLPPEPWVYMQNAMMLPVQEHAAQGELRWSFRPLDVNKGCRIQFSARGFAGCQFETPAGSDMRSHTFDVNLVPVPRVLVSVTPPADGVFSLQLQQRYDNQWAGLAPTEARAVRDGEGPARRVVWEFGDWKRPGATIDLRAMDRLSGVTGPELELRPEDDVIVLSVDLTRTCWLAGHVETPRREDLIGALALTSFDGDARMLNFQGTVESRVGFAVASDSFFKVRLPGDRPVRVRPWHPILAPGNGGEAVVVESDRLPITLRLVSGTSATFICRLPDPVLAPVLLGKGSEAVFYADDRLGKPVSKHQLAFEGDRATMGGFAPGTYTICIRVPMFAPALLHGVMLGKGANDLGEIRLTHGTQLMIENCKDRARRVTVEISVENVGGPAYVERWRRLNPEDEATMFDGLGPGRFSVNLHYSKGDPTSVRKTIEADGQNPVTVSVDR